MSSIKIKSCRWGGGPPPCTRRGKIPKKGGWSAKAGSLKSKQEGMKGSEALDLSGKNGRQVQVGSFPLGGERVENRIRKPLEVGKTPVVPGSGSGEGRLRELLASQEMAGKEKVDIRMRGVFHWGQSGRGESRN